MTNISYHSEKNLVEIEVPIETINRYKKKLSIADNSDITLSRARELFVLAVGDFLVGKISTDDLAAICANYLYPFAIKYKDEDDKFFDAVNSGSELGFYIRDTKLLPLFSGFLKTVLTYYSDQSLSAQKSRKISRKAKR